MQNGAKGEYISETEKAAARVLVSQIREECLKKNCTVIETRGKWGSGYAARVHLESGFWFQVDVDPQCIEIQTKPSTLEELKKLTPDLDHLIFGSANSVGLRPDFATGAGHFNIGARSTFGDDAKAFLRFFVDYANHPEFAAGGMAYDMYNAPPISALSAEQRQALIPERRVSTTKRFRLRGSAP